MRTSVVTEIIERIEKLSPLHDRFLDEFRLLAGVVFALDLAGTSTESILDSDNHLKELHELLNSIKNETQPPTQWLTGFYYNAAITRIAACKERFLGKGGIPKESTLNIICDEANTLKHRFEGQPIQPGSVAKAWEALFQLLDRIEKSQGPQK